MALLAENVDYVADGGGKVVAALKVLRGPERHGLSQEPAPVRLLSRRPAAVPLHSTAEKEPAL